MEGEYFGKRDAVVWFPVEGPKQEVTSAWRESLRRIARAQALLWNATPIAERQALLARVDRETKGEQ